MNHHLESLGWTLVHFCWQAAAIALVYWLTDAVLSKARSQTRYVLALANHAPDACQRAGNVCV